MVCLIDVAPKDLKEINQALKSKQTYQIRYALDTLSIYSSEFKLLFSECPDLLDTLAEYMIELYCELIPDTKTMSRFYTYRELFEMEHMTNHYLQDDSEPTIDKKKQLHEQLTGIGLVFRNASLLPENQLLMAENTLVIQMALKTLSFPVPETTEYIFNHPYSTPVSLPIFTTLEHRKNALILLSNLAQHMSLPDEETTQWIVDVCRDFISELDVYYVYPAIDVLARLFLKQENLQLISECEGILPLCEDLLQLLPANGFSFETTPNQMAQYELVLMVLCNLVYCVGESHQKRIVEFPGFFQILRNCSRRPIAPPMFRPPPELLSQFFAVRERSFKTYMYCRRRYGVFREVEKEMVEWMYRAQREGDQWMVVMIVDFLSDG
jgi:hypothetical protein